jgi:hypothetical protein
VLRAHVWPWDEYAVPDVCWVCWGHLQLEGFVRGAAVAVQRVVHGCVCVFVRMAVVYGVPMNL